MNSDRAAATKRTLRHALLRIATHRQRAVCTEQSERVIKARKTYTHTHTHHWSRDSEHMTPHTAEADSSRPTRPSGAILNAFESRALSQTIRPASSSLSRVTARSGRSGGAVRVGTAARTCSPAGLGPVRTPCGPTGIPTPPSLSGPQFNPEQAGRQSEPSGSF